MKPITSLCVVTALAGLVAAQQPNSPAASFVVNGNAGPIFPITGLGAPRGGDDEDVEVRVRAHLAASPAPGGYHRNIACCSRAE